MFKNELTIRYISLKEYQQIIGLQRLYKNRVIRSIHFSLKILNYTDGHREYFQLARSTNLLLIGTQYFKDANI